MRRYLIVGLAVALFACPGFAQQVGIFENQVTLDSAHNDHVAVPGSITEANGVYTITGNGHDIWEEGDEGFIAYNTLEGANSISAKVKWIQAKGGDAGGNDWAKIGVMVRENGDDPASKHYWIEMRCGAGDPALGDRTDAQWRDETGSASGNVQIFDPDGNDIASEDGIWLRVTRNPANNVLVSEYSYDGMKWNFANARTVPMQPEVAYGIIITSHTDDDQMVIAEVSDVNIGPTAISVPPKPDDFEERTLSDIWTAVNLGTGPKKGDGPSSGSARPRDGEIQITNNGWDAWEDDDGMGFIYQVVAGDFDVALKVAGFDGDLDGNPGTNPDPDTGGGNQWEKGGIIFRQSLDAGAPYVSSMISRSYGLRAQYRLEQGGSTDRSRRGNDGMGPKAGWWVRLIRTGDQFEILCAESKDGPWLPPDDNMDRHLPDNTLVISDPAFLGIGYTPHSTDNEAVFEGTGIFDDFIVYEAAQPLEGWEMDHGNWVVEDGVLKMTAEDDTDPKHAWVPINITPDYTVQADMMIVDWLDGEDMSRAGIGVRIQPGDEVQGLNLLFHNSIGQVQFLNDKRGWGPQEAIPWVPGAWYTLTMSINGNVMSGSVAPAGGTSPGWMMADWDGGSTDPRPEGFPGVAGNSNLGEVWYDNFKVIQDGQVVFSDNFEDASSTPSWELMK